MTNDTHAARDARGNAEPTKVNQNVLLKPKLL